MTSVIRKFARRDMWRYPRAAIPAFFITLGLVVLMEQAAAFDRPVDDEVLAGMVPPVKPTLSPSPGYYCGYPAPRGYARQKRFNALQRRLEDIKSYSALYPDICVLPASRKPEFESAPPPRPPEMSVRADLTFVPVLAVP